METFNIYLSGKMGNLSYEEQTMWRNQVHNAILYGDYDLIKKPVFLSPPEYYSFDEPVHKSEREVFEFDLYKLRKSDLIVVNLNHQDSVGTIMELAIAYEHRIPIIGLNETGQKLHPWFECCVTRMCDNMKELVEHIVDFYLN